MQHLNPHVVNSLFCLGGIVLCLALIVGGWLSDRRRIRRQARAEPKAQAIPARRASSPRHLTLKGELSYRQVA